MGALNLNFDCHQLYARCIEKKYDFEGKKTKIHIKYGGYDGYEKK